MNIVIIINDWKMVEEEWIIFTCKFVYSLYTNLQVYNKISINMYIYQT